MLNHLKIELPKEDSLKLSTFRHSKSKWVEYEITKVFPFGMPWEKFDDIKERNPSDRLVFVLQIASEDTPRLVALLEEVKVKTLWGDIFGETAFTVQLILTKQISEDASLACTREPYVEMVWFGPTEHGLGQYKWSCQLYQGAPSMQDKRRQNTGHGIQYYKVSFSVNLIFQSIVNDESLGM